MKVLNEGPRFYRRYTNIPSLISILQNKQLTLLDPQLWEDKNDSYFLSLYKQKNNLKTVLALCMSFSTETFHHWNVFSPGSSGVCISFIAEDFLVNIKSIKYLKIQDVNYLTVKELKNKKLTRKMLPFIKRSQFEPEKEVRLLWESKTDELQAYNIPIKIESIAKITLSPWLHPSLTDGLRTLLKSIDGCDKIKIYKSTLIHNSEWMKYGDLVK